jgi:hypothetical protein
MRAPLTSYTVQIWFGNVCHTTIADLSIDAARYLGHVHSLLGDTVRLLADGHDYTEVWRPTGEIHTGPIAHTTHVSGAT